MKNTFPILLLSALATAFCLCPQSATATFHTVTNLSDSGAGSLRDAMTNSSSGDTIGFAGGLTGTITLASSLPAIVINLSIINTNVPGVTINGNSHDTFYVVGGTVTVSGFVIRNSNPLMNHGNYTINQCVIADASFGSGGVFNFAVMTLNACTITNNGGGIHNQGPLVINNSTISDNHIGTGGQGGAILNTGPTLAMTNCTISRNSVGGATGGNAGGIYNGNISTLILNSCTICSNSCGSTALANGGGIYNAVAGSTTGQVQVVNTLISGNTATGSGPDIFGPVTSLGFNFISATNDSTGWTASDQTGSVVSPINPALDSLQNNGGLTPTHALLPGSRAIGAGNSGGLTGDQRGFPRPVGSLAVAGGDRSDIGAFEVPASTAIIPILLSNSQQLGNGAFQFDFTNAPNASFTALTSTSLGTDLSTWTALGEPIEIASGHFQFTDTQATNHSPGFYGVRSP